MSVSLHSRLCKIHANDVGVIAVQAEMCVARLKAEHEPIMHHSERGMLNFYTTETKCQTEKLGFKDCSWISCE